jgi:hypothetical protein
VHVLFSSNHINLLFSFPLSLSTFLYLPVKASKAKPAAPVVTKKVVAAPAKKATKPVLKKKAAPVKKSAAAAGTFLLFL